MNPGMFTKSLLATGLALAIASCSSSSSGADVTAPTVAAIQQNRTVDPMGNTVDVIFSEAVSQAEAETLTNYTSSAGNILSATLQPDTRTVRLVLDIVAVPGDVTFDIAAGAAAAGNIDFTGAVTAGDTVTISDGTDSFTFEFNTGGAAAMGNIEVDPGANVGETVTNFIDAINAADFNITASAGAGDSADVVNDNLGIDGNVAITDTEAGAVIAPTGFTGGAGIRDITGNVIDVAIATQPVTSTDAVAPGAMSVSGVTIEGPDNDQLSVVFNDDMIQSEVETLGNWSAEAPAGNAFDLTNATISYDPMTRTATVDLGATVPGEIVNGNGNNLQTFDSIELTFANMRDVSGNAIVGTAFSGMSDGDRTPPTFLSVWNFGGTDLLNARFSEPVQQFAFGDLYSGGNDPGPRILLNDADGTAAVNATGTATITADPSDGDTIVITDGVNTDTYEWDLAGGGVGGGNIAVAITAGDNNQMATDFNAAITASGTANITNAVNGVTLNQVDLTAGAAGAAFNANTITETGTAVTVTGFANGADATVGQPAPVAGNFAFEADGTGVTMDFAPSTPDVANDTAELYGIRDLAGNQAFGIADFDIVARNSTAPSINGGASAVTTNPGENNDEIVVTFADPISPYFAEEPSNYDVTQGGAIDLSDATFEFDGVDTVTIRLGAENLMNSALHSVFVVNNPATQIRTAQGFPLTGNSSASIASTGDGTGVASATAFVGNVANTVIVVFPEAVDTAGALLTTAYEIATVNPTTVDQLTPRAFQLTFATQPAAAQTLTINASAGNDLAGNAPTAVLDTAITAADATAPTATFAAEAAEGTNDSIFVDFDEAMDQTSVLDSSNYSFIHNGAAIDLSNATFTYESFDQGVRIVLPESFNFTFGNPVTATFTGLEDLSGNALTAQPAGVNVIGDNTDPGFASPSSAFVNYIADANGFAIDVLFSEAVSETFVETIGNWTTSGSTIISGVQMLSQNTARITTTTQIGASETLSLNNLPDVAGNAGGGMITVDPIE